MRVLIGHRRKFITPRAAKVLVCPTAQGYFTTTVYLLRGVPAAMPVLPAVQAHAARFATVRLLPVGWQAGAGQPQTRSYTAILMPVPLLACRTEQFVQVGEANL